MKPMNINRRRPSLRWVAAAIALAIAVPAQADSVTDWNAVAGSAQMLARFGAPQFQYRMMAITHVAIHDALNSIQPRYESYNALPGAGSGASADAAVAAAARTVLLGMINALPAPTGTQAAIDAEWAARQTSINNVNIAYAAAIGPGVPDGAEAAGIAAGEAAANAIFLQRHVHDGVKWVANDGSQNAHSPSYLTVLANRGLVPGSIGVHQATPTLSGALTQPLFMGWENVKPFSINNSEQFRTPPSPQLFDVTSAFYADQYNEVKHHGDARIRGAFPNSEKTLIGRFWPAGGLEWNTTLRIIVDGRGLDRWEHARLFALANVSVADSATANLRSKYYYNFWRPITAIRAADDGNPLTESDPTWMSFLPTPPYPDYPCGSTGVTGAVTQTLRNFFGTNAIGFERTVSAPLVALPAPLAPLQPTPITRKYMSLSIAENEQARARMYEGLHFTEGCYAGIKAANRVADWVYAHDFGPL